MVKIVNLAITPGYRLGDKPPVTRLYFEVLIENHFTSVHSYRRNQLFEKIEDFCLFKNLNMYLILNSWPVDKNYNFTQPSFDEKPEVWGQRISVIMNFEKTEDAHTFKREFLVLMKLSGEKMFSNN